LISEVRSSRLTGVGKFQFLLVNTVARSALAAL
jgi:hypothetical protein